MPGPSPEEGKRVRDYMIAQAAKLTIPELVAKLRTDTAALRDAAAAVPPARWNERPSEGDWSAAEVCGHVLEMNEHGASAIEAILAARLFPTMPAARSATPKTAHASV